MQPRFAVIAFVGICALAVGSGIVSAQFTAPTTDFSFVSDVEVTWRGRSSVARMFVDTQTRECRLVMPNMTSILVARGASDVQVQTCSGGALSARITALSRLDEESRVLARICGVLSWPSASGWANTDWTRKQITRVPVYTNIDSKCSLATHDKDTSCDCTCEYAFDENDWVGESRQALRAVTVSGCPASCGFADAYVSVMSYWRTSIPPAMLAGSCQEAAPETFVHPRDQWGSLLASVGFPELPTEFSALFKVSLVEYGVNVEFHETFSAPLRAARASVFTARETSGGDIATAETYLTHGTAGVTFRVQHDVTSGSMSTLAGQGAYACQQMVYTTDIFASSVETLLMVPALFPPVRLGNFTVRGIDCELWGQTVSEDLRIEWYFPAASAVTAATGNGASVDKVLPRRIVLRGRGRSPFFTNHPFVPNSVVLPNGDTDYCDRVPFFYNPHCLSNAESGITLASQFEHIVDIAELPSSAARNFSVYRPPDICIGARVVRSTTCSGVEPAVVVVLALICLGIGAAMARCMCPGNGMTTDDGAVGDASMPAQRQHAPGTRGADGNSDDDNDRSVGRMREGRRPPLPTQA